MNITERDKLVAPVHRPRNERPAGFRLQLQAGGPTANRPRHGNPSGQLEVDMSARRARQAKQIEQQQQQQRIYRLRSRMHSACNGRRVARSSSGRSIKRCQRQTNRGPTDGRAPFNQSSRLATGLRSSAATRQASEGLP